MAVNEAEPPHVLLLGGGYTLQRLAKRLKVGSFVLTSRNKAQCDRWRWQGYQAEQVALEDQESIAAALSRHPHLRIVVDSVPPLRGSSDPARGVKNVVEVLQGGSTVKRIIYLSTTGVFGVRDGSIVTEETPPAPWNSQGEARLLSEVAYRESQREVVVFRLPAIYGPDRGVHISIRQGTYRLVGDGLSWSNRIHVEDLVTALERGIAFPLTESLPPVLCITDDAPTQAIDIAKELCAREGRPLPGSISEDEVLRSGGYTMLSNQRVSNVLMKKVLGMTLRYPTFKEGCAQE